MPNKVTLEIDRKVLLVIFLAVAGVASFILFSNNEASANPIEEAYNALKTPSAKKLFYDQSEQLTKEVPKRLIELDEKTIGCFGPSKIMQMSALEGNLGGQCCGALKDIESYDLQMQVLEEFIEDHGSIELIPKDPYDITVERAQQLASFDQTVKLSQEQQKIYDAAMQSSHHGGPCCCKCWKWYVMSGLAKELIVGYGWGSEDIAELWDVSSSCGHDEDTNMHKHYRTKERKHAH